MRPDENVPYTLSHNMEYLIQIIAIIAFMRRLQLPVRYDFDSTSVRLPTDCNSTALWAFDDLSYDHLAYRNSLIIIIIIINFACSFFHESSWNGHNQWSGDYLLCVSCCNEAGINKQFSGASGSAATDVLHLTWPYKVW